MTEATVDGYQVAPIQTHYRGHYFRSRLEARWAVFFTVLGVPYEYEPQGYDLGSLGWYLPDFYLPHLKCWIEVKGRKVTDLDEDKLRAVVRATDAKEGFLVGAIPRSDELGWWNDDLIIMVCSPEGWDNNYAWCECPHCGFVGVEFNGRAGRLPCGHGDGDKQYNYDTARLRAAYDAAHAARFDEAWTPRDAMLTAMRSLSGQALSIEDRAAAYLELRKLFKHEPDGIWG